jgi:hypothetical protein
MTEPTGARQTKIANVRAGKKRAVIGDRPRLNRTWEEDSGSNDQMMRFIG